jgi:hypothetical protein
MGWTDRIACMGEEQCIRIIVVQYGGRTKLERVLNLVVNCQGSHKKRSAFTG